MDSWLILGFVGIAPDGRGPAGDGAQPLVETMLGLLAESEPSSSIEGSAAAAGATTAATTPACRREIGLRGPGSLATSNRRKQGEHALGGSAAVGAGSRVVKLAHGPAQLKDFSLVGAAILVDGHLLLLIVQ